MEASIYRCPIKPRSARAGCAGRGRRGGGGGREGEENQRVKLRERKDAPKEPRSFPRSLNARLPLRGLRSRGITSLSLPRSSRIFFSPLLRFIIIYVELTARRRDFPSRCYRILHPVPAITRASLADPRDRTLDDGNAAKIREPSFFFSKAQLTTRRCPTLAPRACAHTRACLYLALVGRNRLQAIPLHSPIR